MATTGATVATITRAKLIAKRGDMPPGADKSASSSDMSSDKRRPHGGGAHQRETDTAVDSMAKATLRRVLRQPDLDQEITVYDRHDKAQWTTVIDAQLQLHDGVATPADNLADRDAVAFIVQNMTGDLRHLDNRVNTQGELLKLGVEVIQMNRRHGPLHRWCTGATAPPELHTPPPRRQAVRGLNR
jgi:hypothetical protein